MIRSSRLLVAALAVSALAFWLMGLPDQTPPAPSASADQTYSESVQGSVVVKDKDTGELRAPTQEEWKELAVDQDLGFPSARRSVEAERRPNGMLSVVTANLPASFSVARIDAQGRVRVSCRQEDEAGPSPKGAGDGR